MTYIPNSCVRYFTIGVQYGFGINQIPHPRLITSTNQYIRVIGRNETDCREVFIESIAPYQRMWSSCYVDRSQMHMFDGVVDLDVALRKTHSRHTWHSMITNHIRDITVPSQRFAWMKMCHKDWSRFSGDWEPLCVSALLELMQDEQASLEAELSQ